MKKVDVDFFTQVQMPCRLRAGGEDRLALLLKQADLEENRTRSQLWLWRGDDAFLLTGDGDTTSFWWKDGRTILFTRRAKDGVAPEAPETVLYALDVTLPGEAVEWLRLPYEVEDLAFLPDGSFLFVAAAGRPPLPEGAEERDRDDYELVTELPLWANGGGYTSGRHSGLWLWRAGGATRLTPSEEHVEALRLAPDGRSALYIGQTIQPVAPVGQRVMRLEVSTLESRDIGPWESLMVGQVVPLADGAVLVYGSEMKEYGINQNGAFYRLDQGPEGWVATTLYSGGAYGDWNSVGCDVSAAQGALWQQQPDGRVLWSTTLADSSHLMAIDPASGAITQLTAESGAVAEFAMQGGRIVYTAMRGLGAFELYTLLPDGTGRALSGWNTALAKDYALSRPRPLAFTGRDGAGLQGWVMEPGTLPAGGKAPAILQIHGGPKTVYGTVLFHEMQYLAAQGYAVLYCNPRGSDGRGDAFADIRGRYGTVDYDDLMAFVDAALEACPWIDPRRLGVAGGSYGGFMVNWIIGHTQRFAAAVSQRGIANWASMATTSDIGYYFEPDQTGATLWQDADAVWAASPLKYADRVKTPTLFIHSEEDYRCPLPEGVQMYTALQLHGVQTRLCLFRGENHDLSRSGKPRHRVTRLREIEAWFRRYLMP